jgi:hypothetical protein
LYHSLFDFDIISARAPLLKRAALRALGGRAFGNA